MYDETDEELIQRIRERSDLLMREALEPARLTAWRTRAGGDARPAHNLQEYAGPA